MSIQLETLYIEGCNAVRHYSNGVKTIRTISIGQGFVIITGTCYLIVHKQFLASIIVASFGLMLTIVLFMLQLNYWKQFDAVLEYVTNIENGDSQNVSKCNGPWSAYLIPRKSRFSKVWYRLLVQYGPYFFLMAALVAFLVFCLYLFFVPTSITSN